jgi:tetratricopeptide (TPR) repeat protein
VTTDAAVAEAAYSLRRLEEMLGLGRSVILGLIEGGFVTPERGPRNEYRFSFQDVVLLRTAYQLRCANIPPRRILKALREIKARLPEDLPLSGLRISAIGNEVAVREGGHAWTADSGQLLIDFEVAPAPTGRVAILERAPARRPADEALDEDDDATAWFERGDAAESADHPREAEAAYRRALALQPGHVHAALNLGVLLADAGRHGDAVTVYDAALAFHADQPYLHFNRAIALEDDGRPYEALEAYAACLKLDPGFADAHYNAARLHEQLGQATKALRHFSAYRRLR